MRDPLNAAALLDHLRASCPDLDKATRRFFVVGGAVRDALLDRPLADVDLAGPGAEAEARQFASASRGSLVRLGRDALSVWRVVLRDVVVDFSDFEGTIEDDLRRRDFTINAMALDRENVALIDPFGGAQDLDARVIRMVREENFDDDPLRCVRAVRMALQCGCTIEPSTLGAVRVRAARLDLVAGERIHEEMEKILASPDRTRGIDLLTATGVDTAVLGAPIDDPSRGIVARTPVGDSSTIWALLLGGRSRDDVQSLARRLRWGRDQERCVVALMEIAAVIRHSSFDPRELPVILYDAGENVARRLPGVLTALGSATLATEVTSRLERDGGWIFDAKPLLAGDEISAITGIAAGRELGTLRRALLEARLRGEVSTREHAIAFVKQQAPQ